jgi:hypothetical protein
LGEFSADGGAGRQSHKCEGRRGINGGSGRRDALGEEGFEALPDPMVFQTSYTCFPSADSFLEALLILIDQGQIGANGDVSPSESFYFGANG